MIHDQKTKVGKIIPTFLLFLLLLLPSVSAATPGANEVYLYSILFSIIIILLVLGYWVRSYFYKIFAGFLLVITGVYSFINGIPNHAVTWFEPGNPDGWIFYSALIMFGLGLYYVVQIAMEHVGGKDEYD